jgi:hypothetical protein
VTRDKTNDVSTDAELNRFALVRRPVVESVPRSDAVGDLDVGRVHVLYVWERGRRAARRKTPPIRRGVPARDQCVPVLTTSGSRGATSQARRALDADDFEQFQRERR